MIVEGISRITPADFKNAVTLGFGIKLLAVITRDFKRNGLCVRIHPTLLPAGNVIANVSGVFNAISVTGDVVGTTLYSGRGAGQDATASAVISDIADGVALLRFGKGAHLIGESVPNARRVATSRRPRAFGALLSSPHREGSTCVLARVASVMARHHVSIASVIQIPPSASAPPRSCSRRTRATSARMSATLKQLSALSSTLDEPVLLRIGTLTTDDVGCALAAHVARPARHLHRFSQLSSLNLQIQQWPASSRNMAGTSVVTSTASRMSPPGSRRFAAKATNSWSSSPRAPA